MEDSDVINSLVESQEALNQSVLNGFDGQLPVTQPWTPSLVKFLSSSLLIFTLVALILCTVLLWRRGSEAPEILKIFGIIIIVGLSALLLIVGFDNEQLTPIVGLFGAIAGYLLGKDTKSVTT